MGALYLNGENASGREGGGVPIATNNIPGKVKPDGTTISVANDGTLSTVGMAVKYELDGDTLNITTL